MGIDTKITLPAPARVRDVADVIGMLLGCRAELRSLGHNQGTYNHVEGVRIEGLDTMPECCHIHIETPDGPRLFLYHYEWDAMGNHGLMPRATAGNIALGVALVDFFGGVVDFSDCDDEDEDYRQPVREDIHASDDQPWDAFQRRMHAVRPLTPADIARYAPMAAYT